MASGNLSLLLQHDCCIKLVYDGVIASLHNSLRYVNAGDRGLSWILINARILSCLSAAALVVTKVLPDRRYRRGLLHHMIIRCFRILINCISDIVAENRVGRVTEDASRTADTYSAQSELARYRYSHQNRETKLRSMQRELSFLRSNTYSLGERLIF